MEELQKTIDGYNARIAKLSKRMDEIDTAAALLEDDREENAAALQEAVLAENTAKIQWEQAKEALKKSQQMDSSLQDEGRSMESELLSIRSKKEDNDGYLEEINERQKALTQSNEELQKKLDEQTYMETAAARNQSELEMEASAVKQKADFLRENLERVQSDLKKHKEAKERLESSAEDSEAEIKEKRQRIGQIQQTIAEATDSTVRLAEQLKEHIAKKEEMDASHKQFFERKEEVSERIANLEKEMVRLETQKERNDDTISSRTNYMWEEYELTRYAAKELADPSLSDGPEMKQELQGIRDQIRSMGTINVGAIEEYAETRERYDFLKGQHDDIVEAQESLTGIINELDEGMRRQFEQGFRDIQREFDKAFKELFGGGKGTLELMPDEDILETGIRIIAQPPGKKLQNMMQLSGGEKSLTAISLLFAIQNLKPSPFCLLDEIEAALDDSNVGRFANYLHKLTKNTQFIVITHRRGTMNAADRLYGITMQEKGISTLVSVNLIENDLDE